jgi:hypothetical protein
LVRKNSQTIETQTNANVSKNKTKNADNRRLTIMLLVISLTFFITSVPIVTLQTIDLAGMIDKTYSLSVIKGIFLCLQYLNHSLNFFLYAISGKTFRGEAINMLTRYFYFYKKKPTPQLTTNDKKENQKFLNNNSKTTTALKKTSANST